MMKLSIPKDKISLNKITHSVRASQAVLQYGVGAMVDFPDQTLMTAAPEYWEGEIRKIHDERLEKVLNVDYFGIPGNKDEFHNGVSYVRFPQWYFCPKCRKFQPISKWHKEYLEKAKKEKIADDPYMKKLICQDCRQELVAARIVVACDNGHIDDFPWVKWVHRRNMGGPRPVCSSPNLTFETGATASAGLEGLIVKCKFCNSKASLFEAFDPKIFEKLDGKLKNDNSAQISDEFMCSGNQPWKHAKTECSRYPRALQRGASSVYFPNTVSSLVIPPYSENINALIEESVQYKDAISFLKESEPDERIGKAIKKIDKWAENISIQISVNFETVKRILARKLLEPKPEDYATTGIKYRAEEYEALTGEIKFGGTPSRDFVWEEKNIADYDIFGIKKVCLIKRIREVRAFTGFTRINPPTSTDDGDGCDGFIPAKEPGTRWYPANEVRGEGIFLEFNDDIITEWVNANKIIRKRAIDLHNAYKKTIYGARSNKKITPKFILLHTLAHLLIRQLSFECGYTIASLRERLYCSDKEDGKEMSGILIYTASGDSEGTLGGLVRQGNSDTLPLIFRKAVQNSLICSNDPVCITSGGQGRDSLNLAACYACALLPETSCEEYNLFLDRAFVIGTFENPDVGFFRKWVE